MKHAVLFLLLGLMPWLGTAQSFTFTTSGGIPDDGTEACFPLPVSGLPARIDSSFGLVSVTLNITHTYIGDLRIRLRSPTGGYVTLVNRRGASGNNMVNTVLRMSSRTPLTSAGAPFTGTFLPDSTLNGFNDGRNPNGTWNLCITDMVRSDTGILNNFTLTFGPNPPADPVAPPAPCSRTNPAGCRCQDSTQIVCDLLPDMTASADIIDDQHTETVGRVTLSNATPNIGWGPMEIHGTGQCYCDTVQVSCATALCPGTNQPPKEGITQRIYQKNGNQPMTIIERPAGYMSYHPGHGHVHVDNWAAFTLRTQGPNPDPSTWPIVATGSKVSFCLVNLGNCSSRPGYCRDSNGQTITMADIPNAGFGSVTGCGRDQGIFTGHLDIYGQGLSGMYIDLPNVCNGNYYIVSITDPDNNFLESDETNNAVAVPITLTRQRAAPAPTFSWSQVGSQLAFFGNGIPAGATFYWNFNDGSPVDSVNNPTIHQFAASGSHSVTLTVRSQCGTTSTTQTLTVLGAADETAIPTFGLRALPNPTTGPTRFAYGLDSPQRVTLDAYNLLGQRVRHLYQGVQQPGDHEATLDLGSLPAGIYLVWLRTERGATSIRVVKE